MPIENTEKICGKMQEYGNCCTICNFIHKGTVCTDQNSVHHQIGKRAAKNKVITFHLNSELAEELQM